MITNTCDCLVDSMLLRLRIRVVLLAQQHKVLCSRLPLRRKSVSWAFRLSCVEGKVAAKFWFCIDFAFFVFLVGINSKKVIENLVAKIGYFSIYSTFPLFLGLLHALCSSIHLPTKQPGAQCICGKPSSLVHERSSRFQSGIGQLVFGHR